MLKQQWKGLERTLKRLLEGLSDDETHRCASIYVTFHS